MNRIRTIVPAIVLLCSSYTTGAQVINVLPRPACITVQQGTYHTPSPLTFCTNARGIDSRVFASLLPDGAKRTRSARKAAVTLTINHKQGPAEGYLLRVTQNNVSIEAPAAEGLFYGLQTLRQLIGPDGNIPCVSIADSARFPYRGIMIDVSRHFFSKDFILKQIDAMSAFKLNRLHLHLTDAAGWRLQINSYPLLTRKGAFRSSKGWKKWWFDDGRRYKTEGEPDAFGGYYTQADIREIVDYARQHFITVIPEVEMPAHSEEVMNAYPQLGCLNADSTMETAKPRADFCPGNEDVFVFWRNVLKEIAALFPSPYIHIGGDEAARTAWRTCPRCKALMQRTGMKDVDELQSYFIRRIDTIANSLGRHIIGWDDITQGGAPADATVMVWRAADNAWQATRQGHTVILSPGQYCYIDAYQDCPLHQPEAIGGYLPLEKIYGYEPLPPSLPHAQAALVQGLQANLWTEYVPTPEHCEEMLYPRALALAEVAWSPATEKDFGDFRRRALVALDTLRAKGYHPFDLAHETGNRPEAKEKLSVLSTGKTVCYNRPYSPYYPAAGAASLTDGLRGGWTYGDGRWQGFIGAGPFDVTIDLQKPDTLHSISADFLQSAGAEVFLPAAYRISTSVDGQQYENLIDATYPADTKLGFCIRRFGWEGTATARYVRFEAQCIPSGGWLFTDEVVVK